MGNEKKKRSYTAREKLQILQELDSSGSTAEISRKYEVDASTIRKWRKNKNKIKQCSNLSEKAKRLNTTLNEKVNEAVWIWFREMRSKGQPVSGPIIKGNVYCGTYCVYILYGIFIIESVNDRIFVCTS